jgi:type I restriction enzyme, S subunit
MSTDLLFGQFATLATAPDGIARLRGLILQLAVQGKLGTQDAGDEPAAKLVERIRKDKELLPKERMVKKEKLLEPKGDLIYPLPKTWISSQLGTIISFEYGKSLPEFEREDSGKVPVYGSNGIVGYHLKAITKGPALIIGRKGSVGAIQISNVPCHPIDTAYYIDNFKNLDQRFLFYLLTSLKLGSLDKSTAIPGLNRNDVYNLLIGLPPLAEQRRIVAKVDLLMALCDELEARQWQERAGCLKLGTASLTGLQKAISPEEFGQVWAQVCEAFDLILDCPENIERLRDTIVALACSGKLTEIWRSDNQDIESASKSFEKLIKERKKKKFLKTNLKQHNFLDFPKIPDTWMWSTIEEVSERVTVGHVGPMMTEYRPTGVPFMRSQNVRKNTYDGKGLVYISQEFHDILSKSKLEPGDLVVVRSGNVGVCCVIPESLKDANCSDLVIVKQPFGFLPRFGAYYVNSIVQTWVNSGKVGMALTHFNTKSVANLPIPLPPLAEQHRIVAEVDELMALCDKLEAKLKERAVVQGKLANSIVKNVAA